MGDDGINVQALVGKLWGGRWLIVGVTFMTSAIAVAYALMAAETYRSETLVQVRQDSKERAGVGNLAAQFGGFVDLVGLSLLGGGDRAVALATLRSRVLVEPFIEEEGLMPRMYQSAWDDAEKRWKSDDPKKQPTLWQAYNDFTRSILQISEDKKTGLVTVAVEWKDPVEAQKWVTGLVARTNKYLKSEAVRETEKNIAYLEEQVKRTHLVEVRQSLYKLMESEYKKQMLAMGTEGYALKTIDPAVVPRKRLRPKRRSIAIGGFLLGGLVGCLIVLGRAALQSRS